MIIPNVEAQPNITILTKLETERKGKLPQGSIINYVYDIKNNDPFSTTTLNENVFITITTCKAPLQKLIKNPNIPPANQLEVWISTESKSPGPGFDDVDINKYTLNDGYLNITIPKPKGNNNGVYIGVYAPKLSGDYYNDNNYHFEIGASVEGFKHQALTESGIFLDDTDKSNAILRTFYTSIKQPSYTTYSVESMRMSGISMSSCAYKANGRGTNVTYNRREKNGKYQSSIYISNLNKGTKYSALVTEVSDDGTKFFTPVEFQTRAQSNCVAITGLKFCDKVSYAVPITVSKNTPADLATGYDNLASSYFSNFTSTVAQYPCMDPQSRFSLVRDCNDCTEAYKDWLCAVTIPRCADENSNNGRERDKPRVQVFDPAMNITQPFTELPPCIDLCYNLTRSCPPDFGFSCPQINNNSTYSDAGSCNSLEMNFSSSSNARIWSSSQWTIIILSLGFIL